MNKWTNVQCSMNDQWANVVIIFCRIRIICWHSFWSRESSEKSVSSSHSLSQYIVSEASFLAISVLFRKSFFDAESFASIKFAPMLVDERINWLIIGRLVEFLFSSLVNRSTSFAKTRVLSRRSIGVLTICTIGYSFVHSFIRPLNILVCASAQTNNVV